jgi:hypothetical protein
MSTRLHGYVVSETVLFWQKSVSPTLILRFFSIAGFCRFSPNRFNSAAARYTHPLGPEVGALGYALLASSRRQNAISGQRDSRLLGRTAMVPSRLSPVRAWTDAAIFQLFAIRSATRSDGDICGFAEICHPKSFQHPKGRPSFAGVGSRAIFVERVRPRHRHHAALIIFPSDLRGMPANRLGRICDREHAATL